jgi:hypothetical protein
VNLRSSVAPTDDITFTEKEVTMSRRAMMSRVIGIGSTSFVSSLLLPISSASAAQYGGFGAGSPEVIDPTTAQFDIDVLKSSSVQKAIDTVREYKSGVNQMQSSLNQDAQVDLHSILVKRYDPATVRTTLNTVNTAFEEDTQRGTDRLIRAILQDVTELDLANAVKAGTSRSVRRVETLQAKLSKLDKAFGDILAFVDVK